MTKTPALINDAGHARIGAAVAAAEDRSAGEIVTIITDRSDSYADISLIWSALGAFTALTLLALFPDFYLPFHDRLTGHWQREWGPQQVLSLAAIVAMAKFLAVWLLQLWQPLKFWLIPRAVKSARTRARAVTCFKIGAERRTHGRTGILIYLSMREHRAEIVADEAIASRVSPDVWGDAMAAMLAHIRNDQLAEGMAAAVEKVGAVLAEHFPRAENDVNELPDRLIEV